MFLGVIICKNCSEQISLQEFIPIKQVMTDKAEAVERGSRLRFIRESLLKMKRPDFCEGSALNENTVKGWELAKHGGLTEKGARKLVTHLINLGIHCNTNWLLYGIGTQPRKLNSYISTEGFEQLSSEEDQIAEELLIFRKQGDTLDAMIDDCAMLPFYRPNDYVAGIREEICQCIDLNCIIIDEQNQTHVKLLKKGDLEGCYHLLSININSPGISTKNLFNTKIIAAAPIIWVRRHRIKT